MQQQLLQQALLMQQVAQQPPMFPGHPHPALLAAPPIEPIVSGNLPPGFDSSTCRSVYVGNIHLQVTDTLLQEVFQSIGPVEGCKLIRKEKKLVKRMHVKTILKTTHSLPLFMSGIFLMRLTRDKGFGFVRYITHDEAALAIQMGNGQLIGGRQIKCSWGSKPTPPGTASAPLPPPAPALFPTGMSAADLLAYQRTLALSKMAAANRALMGQHALKPASLGMDAGASPAIYDGGFQGANTASQQQLMYY